jgi:hypothetical protein
LKNKRLKNGKRILLFLRGVISELIPYTGINPPETSHILQSITISYRPER